MTAVRVKLVEHVGPRGTGHTNVVWDRTVDLHPTAPMSLGDVPGPVDAIRYEVIVEVLPVTEEANLQDAWQSEVRPNLIGCGARPGVTCISPTPNHRVHTGLAPALSVVPGAPLAVFWNDEGYTYGEWRTLKEQEKAALRKAQCQHSIVQTPLDALGQEVLPTTPILKCCGCQTVWTAGEGIPGAIVADLIKYCGGTQGLIVAIEADVNLIIERG